MEIRLRLGTAKRTNPRLNTISFDFICIRFAAVEGEQIYDFGSPIKHVIALKWNRGRGTILSKWIFIRFIIELMHCFRRFRRLCCSLALSRIDLPFPIEIKAIFCHFPRRELPLQDNPSFSVRRMRTPRGRETN